MFTTGPALLVESANDSGSTTEGKRSDHLLNVARAASQGSASAIRTLVLHVGPSMLMTVRKILGAWNPEVDDTTQDAVIAFLDALSRFREESSVMTFAQRVALLTALAARRKAIARNKYITNAEDDSADATCGGETPQSILLAKRRREVLLRLLDELPQATAEALALHFVLGMTVDEIAAASNAPVNTIWSRLRLGKQALRRKLSTDASAQALLEEAP